MSDVVGADEQFYSTTKVAELFGVTSETVTNWIKRGVLENCIQVAGRWRIPRASVLKLANSKYGPEAVQ